MAEIICNLATEPETRNTRGTGDEYTSFRVAENSGKGDGRRTTWYDVRAKLPQQERDKLASGNLVRIRGRLESSAFFKKKALEGVPVPKSWDEFFKVVKQHEALGSSIVILTSSVEPHQFRPKDKASDESTGE